MTNNQLCSIIGIAGCVIVSFSMGFMFFGVSSAIWGAIVGIICSCLALVNYDLTEL